jgi:hypothetical protein
LAGDNAMKMIRVIAATIILALTLAPTVALAATSADVTVTATPAVSSGISGFTVTYISDTQMDISWGFIPPATNIMIRGQYGSYPDDIPDEFTAPTDGYLVYYGNALAVSDTSMDFDKTFGQLYYKAWAQKADGTWYTDTSNTLLEGKTVVLMTLLGLGLILSLVAIFKHQIVIGIVGAGAWLVTIIYTRSNPIGGMVTGDTADSALLTVFIAMMILPPILAWQIGKNDKGRQIKEDGWKERSITGDKKHYSLSEMSSPARGKMNESSDEYYDRLYHVTHSRRR